MSLKLIPTFAFILFSFTASAQLEKTIHQTFDVSDFDAISVDLIGDSTVVLAWAGNTILTETKVKLYDASPSIMAHFMEKEQRYAIQGDTVGTEIRLYSVKKERKPIRTRSGECPEYVNIRVFVPEDFVQNGNRLVRQEEP